MIKYLGSKRLLIPQIMELVTGLPDVHRVLDLFSGASRVGYALKAAGYDVVANDHNAYAYTLARCYIQADATLLRPAAEQLIAELADTSPAPGWFTETYCHRSRYFMPDNGAEIDAIRESIATRRLDPDLEAIALTALMEAADRVNSTTGLQMAYLKQWAPRARHPLELRVPDLLPGPGQLLQLEALDAARQTPADLVYLDPPYNQHSYRGNYHIWESLVRWDKPEVYGVACKRIDCRQYHSPFNSHRLIYGALTDVVHACRARYLMVSFNNEGYVDRAQMEALLGELGPVTVEEVDFKRYVGAQIGIHNQLGERVGHVSHLRNKELLYLVKVDAANLSD